MRNFPKRLSLLISVLLVSLLSVTASGTEAAFEDSSEAQIEVKAAKMSSSLNGNETVGALHFYWDQIPANGTAFRDSTYTIINTGDIDNALSIIIDQSSLSLTQNTILNHTKATVRIDEAVVYDGPLNRLQTSPVRINTGQSVVYSIDLSIVYSPDLEVVEKLSDWQTIPIKHVFTLADNPESTYSYSKNGSIMYRMLKWKITSEDIAIRPGSWDDRCVDVDWYANWSRGNYTFQYSKNPDMSNATTIQTTYQFVSLKGLSWNTKYYYQVLAKDSVRPTWSSIYNFTTGSRDGGALLSCV